MKKEKYEPGFTCSICEKKCLDKDGMYLYYDKDKSIMVCNTHVKDEKAEARYKDNNNHGRKRYHKLTEKMDELLLLEFRQEQWDLWVQHCHEAGYHHS